MEETEGQEFSSNDGGALKKWLDSLADSLKRLVGKAVEALPAIVGSVLSAVLSFLGNAVGFVAEHIWASIVSVAELVSVWLMQKVKKSQTFASVCLPMHLGRSGQRVKCLGWCAVK